jgi:hypothetical protein
MKIGPFWVTERMIHRACESALRAKIEKQQKLPPEKRKPYSLEDLRKPDYQAWIKDRVAAASAEGRLLTEIQYSDMLANRLFKVGDRARYVGPSRLEPASSGRMMARPSGQLGWITQCLRNGEKPQHWVTFRPDVPKGSETVDIEIVELHVLEGSRPYFEIERVLEK